MANLGGTNLLIKLAKVDNNIIQLQFNISQDVDVYLSKKEKSEYRLDRKMYSYQVNKLANHHEQVFGLIISQRTQLLQDKMKQDLLWIMVSKSYDPLTLSPQLLLYNK